MFLRRGLDATTAEIAERAGVSESLIFYRYKTKEALFVAVIDKMIVLSPSLTTLPERVGLGDITDHLYEVGVGIVEGTLGEAAGKLYVQQYFKPEAKARMDALPYLEATIPPHWRQ